MQKIIFVAGLALALNFPVQAEEKKEEPKKPETVKVCVDVQGKDGKPVMDKNGKPKQECKEMKKHKKYEGTEIPPEKKK